VSRPVSIALAVIGLLPGLASADASRGRSLGPSVLRHATEERRAEQGILTPIRLDIELPAELPAKRVLVHYKTLGTRDWTTLELRRTGERWKGAIPCLEVSTITGDVSYYLRVHAADGAVIAYSGSRYQPYRVRIVYTASSDGEGRCPDPSDCPPGLPGCPSERVERVPCKSDGDCEGGATCGWDGYCERTLRRLNWLSLELKGSVGFVSRTGACSIAAQETAGYACYRQRDGATYLGNPVHTNEPIAAAWAPPRVVVGYERVLFRSSSVGLRAGYAFLGSGPTPASGVGFLPISGELRLSHWFGRDPFAGARLKPYAFAAAGFAMHDLNFEVHVREDPLGPPRQGANDLEQTLDVWKRAGDAYVALGGGAQLALSSGTSLGAELSLEQAFPFDATLVGASFGYHVGF
jgi:hypothetical protein